VPTIDPDLLTFEAILQRLRSGEPFSFTRWGDGEWIAAGGKRLGGKNCDGVAYTPLLRDRLRASLVDLKQFSNHVFGLQRLALRLFPGRIDQLAPGVRWAAADVFHDASLAGRIPQLLSALAPLNVILIGPEHLAPIAAKLHAALVPVHPKNAWGTQDAFVLQEVHDLVSMAGSERHVVGLSAGPGSKEWASRLLMRYGDHQLSVIDFGSVWDPYVGVASRRYMRNKAVEFSI
jgi:hypothetical protein